MTPILSQQDVKDLIQIRDQQDKKEFSIYLSSLLVNAVRKINLKQLFVECLEAGIDPQVQLCDLERKTNFNSITFNVEDIMNEYSLLEQLERECGTYVQAYYYECSKTIIRIALKFAPPPTETKPSVDPPFTDPIWDRRLEKETSW
jgi:hypothetical protein